MSTGSDRTLYLERPAFWTESADPEAWFRALEALAAAAEARAQTGTPRTVAERCLVGVIAWRGAVGLFGASEAEEGAVLHGTGLVTRSEDGTWQVSEEGEALVRRWQRSPEDGLTALAGHLVRESPWLRLLLLRLAARDWHLEQWARARAGRAGLRAGFSIRLEEHAQGPEWFAGLEARAAGRWLARTHCTQLALVPAIANRKKGKDDLSLAPLTAPLHLLETVGWLKPQGMLQLPAALNADLYGRFSAAEAMTEITKWRADVRGFVAVEPALRELLAMFGVDAEHVSFHRWMDELLEQAVATGALEVLAAEPGQARHGRGLFGDPKRKLVRWVTHPEFTSCFENTSKALGSGRNALPPHPRADSEEETR